MSVVKEPFAGRIRRTEERKRQYDIGKFFTSLTPIGLFVFIVVCYSAVVALGTFVGYQKFLGKIHTPDSPMETAVAAVFGLLAFMLAFTFSLTWTRFVNRNGLVIYQAQAVGVVYRRAGFLPTKQRDIVRKLLYEYTSILEKLPGDADLITSLQRIDEIHDLIWEHALSTQQEDLDSELRSLFVSSVNEMINVAVERKTVALVFHIPDAIWGSLLFLAFVGMLAFGYQAGVNGMRKVLQLPWLPVAFGLVIVLISDLNSSRKQRHFKVTQKPMVDLLAVMDKNAQLSGAQ